MAITNKRNNINKDSTFKLADFTTTHESEELVYKDEESKIKNKPIEDLAISINSISDFTLGLTNDKIDSLNTSLTNFLTNELNTSSLTIKDLIKSYIDNDCNINLDINLELPKIKLFALFSILIPKLCNLNNDNMEEFKLLITNNLTKEETNQMINMLMENYSGENSFDIFVGLMDIEDINPSENNVNFGISSLRFIDNSNIFKNPVKKYDDVNTILNKHVNGWNWDFFFMFFQNLGLINFTQTAKYKSLSLEPNDFSPVVTTPIDKSVYRQLNFK